MMSVRASRCRQGPIMNLESWYCTWSSRVLSVAAPSKLDWAVQGDDARRGRFHLFKVSAVSGARPGSRRRLTKALRLAVALHPHDDRAARRRTDRSRIDDPERRLR